MQASGNLSQASTRLIGRADLFVRKYIGSVSELNNAPPNSSVLRL